METEKPINVEQRLEEIRTASIQANWREENGKIHVHLSLPHGCSIEGYLDPQIDGSLEMFIAHFGVMKELQGSGIGVRLLRAIISQALRYGAQRTYGEITGSGALKAHKKVCGEENLSFLNTVTRRIENTSYTKTLSQLERAEERQAQSLGLISKSKFGVLANISHLQTEQFEDIDERNSFMIPNREVVEAQCAREKQTYEQLLRGK